MDCRLACSGFGIVGFRHAARAAAGAKRHGRPRQGGLWDGHASGEWRLRQNARAPCGKQVCEGSDVLIPQA
jgi:hypothetical protein